MFNPPSEDGETRVHQMLSASPHRGGSLSTLAVGGCVLGVARTDNVDEVSIAENDGWLAAVIGRFDNMDELARETGIAAGTSAARFVIGLAAVLGDLLPSRLRGVYAVVLSDGKSLKCFRDHLGFAPLFFRTDAGLVLIASEPKQVLAGAGIPREADLEVLNHIFYEVFDDETACALQGVRRLPKASVLAAGRAGTSISRYWFPERLLETARYSDEELAARFDTLMAQAVTRAMTGSDIVTLSGGIDSPAVAAFAAPQYRTLTGRSLPALTAVYPKFPAVDERPYVELIVARLGLELHTYEPEARPLDDLDRWVRLADGPFPTTSMAEANEVYRLVRSLGYRNILTGELAEFVVDFRANLVPHLLARGRLTSALRYLRLQRQRGAPLGALIRQIVATATPVWLQTRFGRSGGRTGYLPDWIDPPSWSRAVTPPPPPRARWRQAQLGAFIGPGLSLEADEVVQSVTGVRVRRPWADVDLWEFFLSLRAETKFPDARSKTLVRRLLKGKLPDEIVLRRSKTVFDEAVRARIDYRTLRRLLVAPTYRVPGVDYQKLRDALESEDLDVTSFILARDLAAIHAFLAQC